MKKLIIAALLATTAFACKKSATETQAPVRYYFKIEAVDNDGAKTVIPYKTVNVN